MRQRLTAKANRFCSSFSQPPPCRQQSDLPNVCDGLTRVERIILWQLYEAQKEFGERNVPTATLYRRVAEHINLSVGAFQKVLQCLVGAPCNTARIEN